MGKMEADREQLSVRAQPCSHLVMMGGTDLSARDSSQQEGRRWVQALKEQGSVGMLSLSQPVTSVEWCILVPIINRPTAY